MSRQAEPLAAFVFHGFKNEIHDGGADNGILDVDKGSIEAQPLFDRGPIAARSFDAAASGDSVSEPPDMGWSVNERSKS